MPAQVPTWFHIPRVGCLQVSSKAKYIPMECPVSVGSRVFVDSPAFITSIDEYLQGVNFSGICTSNADVTSDSSKLLQFEVNLPCVLYVCWDVKCLTNNPPKWLQKKNFALSNYKIHTNSSVHIVYARSCSTPIKMSLGGCGSKVGDNFFVLVSAPYPIFHRSSSSLPGSGVKGEKGVKKVRSFLDYLSPLLTETLPEHVLPANGISVFNNDSLKMDAGVFSWHIRRDVPLRRKGSEGLYGVPQDMDDFSSSVHEVQNIAFNSNFSKTRLTTSCLLNVENIVMALTPVHREHATIAFGIQKLILESEITSQIDSRILFDFTSFTSKDNYYCVKLAFEMYFKSVVTCLQTASNRPIKSLEYVLEPTIVDILCLKRLGDSSFAIACGTRQVSVFNIAPSMLTHLLQSYNEISTIIRNTNLNLKDNIVSDIENKAKEEDKICNQSSRVSENYSIDLEKVIFYNNLGQNIRLKIRNIFSIDVISPDDGTRREQTQSVEEESSFACNISSNDRVEFKLPKSSHHNMDDALQSIVVDLETDGWTKVSNIALSLSDSMLYPIEEAKVEVGPNASAKNVTGKQSIFGATWRSVHGTSGRDQFLNGQQRAHQTRDTSNVTIGNTSNDKCNPYALCVSYSTVCGKSYRQQYSRTIDCGDIFSDDNSVGSEIVSESSQEHDDDKLEQKLNTIVVEFRSNIEFKNESHGDITLSDVNGEIVMENVTTASIVPLPLHILRDKRFEIEKLWSTEKWESDDVSTVSIIKQALNKQIPAKLRVSKEQEAESIILHHSNKRVAKPTNMRKPLLAESEKGRNNIFSTSEALMLLGDPVLTTATPSPADIRSRNITEEKSYSSVVCIKWCIFCIIWVTCFM